MDQPCEKGSVRPPVPESGIGLPALTERYAILSNLSADLMFDFLLLSNGNFVLTWISGRFLTENGISSEDLVRDNSWDMLLHEDDKEAFKSTIQQLSVCEEGEEVEVTFRFCSQTGGVCWMEGRIQLLTSEQNEHTARLVGSVKEMKERCELRWNLQGFGSLYNILNENSAEVCCISDKDRLLYLSPNFEKVLQYRREILFKDPCIFFESIHPNDQGRFLDSFVVQYDSNNTIEEIFRITSPEGDLRWIEARSFPIVEHGQVIRRVGIVVDVSEQKQNANLLKQAVFKAKQARLAEEVFLTNVNHMLRTPLTVMMGYSDILNDEIRTQLNESQRVFLDHVISSGYQLLNRIIHISDLATEKNNELENENEFFNIRDCVDEILGLYLGRATEKGLYLDTQITQTVPNMLPGDMMRIRQVIMNLVANAVSSMPAGEIVVGVDAKKRRGKCCALHVSVKAETDRPDTNLFGRPDSLLAGVDYINTSTDPSSIECTASKSIVERMGGLFWVEQKERGASAYHFTIEQPALS